MDRLDELIEGCKEFDNGNIDELAVLLTELKQRRESDIRPADKFLVNSIEQQLTHMESEMAKIEEEFLCCDIDIEKTVEEVIDLQMSCCTMLAILGLDEQQRMESRRKAIEKNEKRGYYEKNYMVD